MKYVAVRPDDENNAAEWWEALTERYPAFAKSLRRNEGAVIAAPLWNELAALAGFDDGPDYAPTALIDLGDNWSDVVASTHQVFDTLE